MLPLKKILKIRPSKIACESEFNINDCCISVTTLLGYLELTYFIVSFLPNAYHLGNFLSTIPYARLILIAWLLKLSIFQTAKLG